MVQPLQCRPKFAADRRDTLTRNQIKPEEMQIIVDSFQNHSRVLAEGFRVNGEKYTVINTSDTSLWAKQVQTPSVQHRYNPSYADMASRARKA